MRQRHLKETKSHMIHFLKTISIFFLILTHACSNENFSATTYQNSSSTQTEPSQSQEAGINPDMLTGGDGVTIGNGNTNDDEIEDDINEPGLIIGSYLR